MQQIRAPARRGLQDLTDTSKPFAGVITSPSRSSSLRSMCSESTLPIRNMRSSRSSGVFSIASQSTLPTRNTRSQVELYPGFEQPLRLSSETQSAISCGFTRVTVCMSCTVEVHCIQDAKYLLCPVCQSITPLDDCEESVSFGVGLGFIPDTPFPLLARRT